MIKEKKITAFIIAGGKSTRFGSDKLLYKHKGLTLIEYVFNVLVQIFNNIIIIADEKDKFSFLKVPVLPDIIPEKGPIGGIYSALNYSETNLNFCFASDLLYLDAGLIEYMISVSDGYDITVPVVKGFFETLHAVYSKKCADQLKEFIESNEFQVFKLYSKFNMREITESEIQKFADPRTVFANINYIEDFKKRKLKYENY